MMNVQSTAGVYFYARRWAFVGLLLALVQCHHTSVAWIPTTGRTWQQHNNNAVTIRPCVLMNQGEDICSRSSTTQLQMGLRSIIGRIKRRKKDDDDDDDDDSVNSSKQREEEADASFDLLSEDPEGEQDAGAQKKGKWKPSMRLDLKPPVRMGEDTKTKEIDVFGLDKTESVQSRINRIKNGKMTEEEKAAYLRAALASGSTPESRPPLRPPVSKAEKKEAKASPFPGDPIYRIIAGEKKPTSSRKELSSDIVNRMGIDAQKQKREYLNMVTDPHRFDVYRKTSKDPGPSVGKEAEKETKDASSLPPDLGERLGAAATAQEMLRLQAEEDRRVKEEKDKAEREENNKRAKEEAAQRQDAFATQYRNKTQSRQTQSEKDKSDKREKEQVRMKELMKAQEEYWTKKLASEREARKNAGVETENPKGRAQQKKAMAQPATSVTSESAADLQPLLNITAGEEAEQDTQPSPKVDPGNSKTAPPKYFNPDERQLLQDSSAQPPLGRGRPPSSDLNDVRGANRNSGGSSRRTSSVNTRTKPSGYQEEQIRRLKELNSPLPNATPQPNLSKKDILPKRPPEFQPQRPVTASVSQVDRSAAFDNLMRNNLNDVRDPAAKTRDLLNTHSGKASDSSTATGESTTDATTERAIDSPDSANAAVADSRKPQMRNPMSVFFGANKSPEKKDDNDNSDKVQEIVATQNNAQLKVQQQPPEKTGPIRMKLPLDEESTDDEEEGIDSQANPSMSIAEAMKRTASAGSDQEERAKQWGVDISKFM